MHVPASRVFLRVCAQKLTRSGCMGHAQVRVDPKSRIYNRMCVHTGQVDMAPSEPPSLEVLNVR